MIVSPIFFKVVSMLNRASSPNHYFQTSLTVKGTIISVSDIVNPFLSGIELMYLRSTSFEKRSLSLSSSVSGTVGVVLFVGTGLGTIGVVLLVAGTNGTIGTTGMDGIIGIVVLVVGTTGFGTIGVVLLVVVLLVVGTGLGAIGIGVGAIGVVLLVLGATCVFGFGAASILICS